jgi:hypothetical protein
MNVEWYRLEDLAARRFRDIPNNPGIYFIRWSKNGSAVPIPRLNGCDYKGILYIGSAKKLRKRIRELWRGINRKIENHTIGETIIFCNIFEIIKLNEFEISWEELESHQSAIGQEWAAIYYYARKYKEPPPLNLGIRRKYFMILGLGELGRSRLGCNPDEYVRSIINSEV